MAVTERLAIVVDADASKGVAQFKQLGAAAKGMAGPVGQVGGLMGKVSGQLSSLASAAGPAAFLAVGAALAKFGESGVNAFTSLAGEVRSFQRIAGGTAESASQLVFAFKAMGIDAATAAAGIGMLEKRLGSGQANLAKFGVQVARDRAGNTDMAATLANIADAFARTTDPAARATLGAAAFGKSWQTMAPILAKGKAGIADLYAEAERHHLILSADDLQRAVDLKVAMRELKESIQGLQVEAGRGLVPILTTIVGLAERAAERVGEVVSGPPEKASGVWALITRGSHEAIQLFEHLVGSSHHAAAAVAELGVDVASVADALQTSVDADRRLSSSKRTLAADQRALAADTKGYNDLLKQGAVDAEKVADAQRSLADATRSVGHARREQADAQAEYDKAAAASAILGTDTAEEKKKDAADKLADANDNVTSALDRQKAAAADLAKAKAGDPEYQDKLAAAKQRVADDTQAIADAEYQVGQNALASVTAHDAETAALANKGAAVQALLDKYNALIALHPEIAAFLTPQMAALGPSPGDHEGMGPLGGLAAPTAPAPAAPTPAVGGTSTVEKVANVVINVAQAIEDPASLARKIIWHLW